MNWTQKIGQNWLDINPRQDRYTLNILVIEHRYNGKMQNNSPFNDKFSIVR